jgi:serine protease Do
MNDYEFQNGFYNYTPKNSKKKKKKYGVKMIIFTCVLSALIGFSGALAGFYYLLNNDAFESNNSTEMPMQENNVSINVDEQATSVVEAVAKKVTPSVVGIRTTTSVQSFFGNDEASGEGSGVIYRKDGYIVTNYHVIADAVKNSKGKIEVFLGDLNSKAYAANVVGYNIATDLAVIKIDAKNLTAVEIADSSKLKVGQYVITVGNPGGLEFMDSVTYGVISGLNRVVSSDSSVSLIQTDAAINPGNSGGALVNVTGELVGINSSKIVSEEFEGMGFAVPSNTMVEICDKIIENENSPEPYIGITLSEKYTSSVLAFYGYPSGAVVLSVFEGSPAYNAGIRRGDIITSFNGKAVKDYTVFGNLVSQTKPNDKIAVEIYRNGRNYSTTVIIGSNTLVE